MNEPTILIVDDEKRWLKSMALLFNNDFNILTATNGKEGLSIIEKQTVQIAIIDLNMPVMNGIEMLKQLRSMGNKVKVLILTGNGSYDYAKQCADLNVQGFIEKPFDPDELSRRLREMTGLHEFTGLRELWEEEYPEKLRKLNTVDLKILEYIENNTRKSITRNEVAQHVNISPDYCGKIFKNSCGTSIKEYIILSKLCLCKKLLTEARNTPIHEVAASVGINDFSYFCKFFKGHTGMTPKEFRLKPL